MRTRCRELKEPLRKAAHFFFDLQRKRKASHQHAAGSRCVLQWWRLRRGVNTVTRLWCCVRCMVCAVVWLRGVLWICRCGCVPCTSSGRSMGFGGPTRRATHSYLAVVCASLSLFRVLSVHTRCGSSESQVSSGLRGPSKRRARLTHRVLQLPNCHALSSGCGTLLA